MRSSKDWFDRTVVVLYVPVVVRLSSPSNDALLKDGRDREHVCHQHIVESNLQRPREVDPAIVMRVEAAGAAAAGSWRIPPYLAVL